MGTVSYVILAFRREKPLETSYDADPKFLPYLLKQTLHASGSAPTALKALQVVLTQSKV